MSKYKCVVFTFVIQTNLNIISTRWALDVAVCFYYIFEVSSTSVFEKFELKNNYSSW